MISQILTLACLIVAIAADILFGLKTTLGGVDHQLTYNQGNLGVGTGTPVIITSHEPLGQWTGLTTKGAKVGYITVTPDIVGFIDDHFKGASDLRIKDGVVSYYALQFYACEIDIGIVIRAEKAEKCEKVELNVTPAPALEEVVTPEPPVTPVEPPVTPPVVSPNPFKNVTIITHTTHTIVTITSCAGTVKNCPLIVTTYPVVITTTVGPATVTTTPIVHTPTVTTTPKPTTTPIVSVSKSTSSVASVSTANNANAVAMGGMAVIAFAAMLV